MKCHNHILGAFALVAAWSLLVPAAHAQLPMAPYGGNPYLMYGGMSSYGGMNSYGGMMYYYDPVSSVVYLRQSIAQFDKQGEVGIGGLSSNPYGGGYGM